MRLDRVLPFALTLLTGLSLPVAAAHAAPTVTEFTTGGGPVGIARGADGNVWFADNPKPAAVGRVTPTGTVTTFRVPTSDVQPTDIASSAGDLWFTESGKNRIGRVTTAGAFSEFPAGAHETPAGITAGPDGNVWYTLTGKGGAIARITPAGTVTEFTSGLTANSSPQDITAGPDGNLWFTEAATNRIGRITPQGQITEFAGGALLGSPREITTGPDGNLWYTDQGLFPAVARMTTTGAVTVFRSGLPSGSLPQGITTGADGNVYFTDSGADAIGRVTPAGGITSVTAGITPGAALRGIATGADGRLWFAESATGKVGRMTVGPGAGNVTASGVTDASATLSGAVTPNSEATTYHFEWGTTAGTYDQQTADVAVGSGATPQTVSAGLSGLSASTTYHVRLVATNGTDTTYGPDQIFTTTAPGAPSATSEPATGVTPSEATLNATVNPRGGVTTYRFEWGADTSYGNLAPATATAVGSDASDHQVGETLTGLSPNTTYHFRVVATSASGTTYGSDRTVTTVAPAPAASTAAASAVTASGATLTGTVDPNNSATSYRFEWGPTAAYGNSVPAVDALVAGDDAVHAVTERITGLLPGTTYHFRLVATSNAGVDRGADLTFTTAPAAPAPAPGDAAAVPPLAPEQPAAPGSDAAPVQAPAAGQAPPAVQAPAAGPRPRPELGRTAVAKVTRGTIRFRRPGSRTSIELRGETTIPAGAIIDARNGTLVLENALDASGRTQQASFRGAQFSFSLSRRDPGMMEVRLRQAPPVCRARGGAAFRAAKGGGGKPVRGLWIKDRKGKYRTHGRNSVAIVRGTEWSTTETCAGTVTRVMKGAVQVKNLRTGKSVLVRAGHSYVARRAR